jgi:hypothetical protein
VADAVAGNRPTLISFLPPFRQPEQTGGYSGRIVQQSAISQGLLSRVTRFHVYTLSLFLKSMFK